jgi:hypothetical protein
MAIEKKLQWSAWLAAFLEHGMMRSSGIIWKEAFVQ